MVRHSFFIDSIEASLVAHNFPLNKILELLRVRNHVFVVVQLLVGAHNAKVYSGQVDLSRVLLLTVPDEREMRRQVVSGVLDRVLRARLVMQEAKLECRLRLRLFHRGLLVAQVQHLHQVLDCLASVISFRVGLSEEFVRLDLLRTIASFLAEVKEEFTLLNGSVKLTLSLVDHADLLIALSFDVTVLSLLGHCEALLEELERHIEFTVLEILIRDHLVNTHQVL